MENTHFDYSIEKISHKDVCKYTIPNVTVSVTDISTNMSSVNKLAYLTDFFSEPHTHSFYNVAWIEHGGFNYMVDTETYFVPDNSILMFVPGGLHNISNASTENSGTSIDFTEEYFQFIDETSARVIKHDVMKNIHVLPIRDAETQRQIKDIISMLRHYVHHGDDILSKAQIYSALTLLLCTVGKSKEHSAIKENSCDSTNPTHQLFLSFTDMIARHYREHHDVKFYQERLNVGINVLNRCCKSNAASTPLAVITEHLMLEAKRMLLHTEMKSNEISEDLGFEEPSHFSSFFRRHTHMTPSKFRETYRKQ